MLKLLRKLSQLCDFQVST